MIKKAGRKKKKMKCQNLNPFHLFYIFRSYFQYLIFIFRKITIRKDKRVMRDKLNRAFKIITRMFAFPEKKKC